jgi:hypothetical protein
VSNTPCYFVISFLVQKTQQQTTNNKQQHQQQQCKNKKIKRRTVTPMPTLRMCGFDKSSRSSFGR